MPATENSTHVIQVKDLIEMLKQRDPDERIKVYVKSSDNRVAQDYIARAANCLEQAMEKKVRTIASLEQAMNAALRSLESIDLNVDSDFEKHFIDTITTKDGDAIIECV